MYIKKLTQSSFGIYRIKKIKYMAVFDFVYMCVHVYMVVFPVFPLRKSVFACFISKLSKSGFSCSFFTYMQMLIKIYCICRNIVILQMYSHDVTSYPSILYNHKNSVQNELCTRRQADLCHHTKCKAGI